MADPRLTPARSDLAAKHLEGKVEAARFVEGEACEVIEPIAPVRRAAASDAEPDADALTRGDASEGEGPEPGPAPEVEAEAEASGPDRLAA